MMVPLYATSMNESWQARARATNGSITAPLKEGRPDKDSFIRRLALAKLRELRRAGLSYREIGMQFGLGRAQDSAEASGFPFRLPPERLLARAPSGNTDAAMFLCALDAVDQGLAFFDCTGTLLHANRAVVRVLEGSCQGERLRAEIEQFAMSMCAVVGLRHLNGEQVVEEIAVREVPTEEEHYRLRSSYVGLDLFNQGGSVMVALERPAATFLSAEGLRVRFGLSKQESRIAHLLARGKSNESIAKVLFISPHTARTHTQRILDKLGVHARAEVATKILTRNDHTHPDRRLAGNLHRHMAAVSSESA
jgi:DNA-binding CsgD family transcriptional regulator